MNIYLLIYIGFSFLVVINLFRLPRKYKGIMEKADEKLLEQFINRFSEKVPSKLDDTIKQQLIKEGYEEKKIENTFLAVKINKKKQIFLAGPKIAVFLVIISILEYIGLHFKASNVYIEAGTYVVIGIILLIFFRKNRSIFR